MQLLLSVLHPAALGETANAGILTEKALRDSLIPCVKHQKSIIRGTCSFPNRVSPWELTRGHTEHGNPGQHTSRRAQLSALGVQKRQASLLAWEAELPLSIGGLVLVHASLKTFLRAKSFR